MDRNFFIKSIFSRHCKAPSYLHTSCKCCVPRQSVPSIKLYCWPRIKARFCKWHHDSQNIFWFVPCVNVKFQCKYSVESQFNWRGKNETLVSTLNTCCQSLSDATCGELWRIRSPLNTASLKCFCNLMLTKCFQTALSRSHELKMSFMSINLPRVG